MNTLRVIYFIAGVSITISLFIFSSTNVQAAAPATPRGPHYACDLTNGTATIKWFDTYNASEYWFRLDAEPRSWTESCSSTNDGDICRTSSDAEVTVPITPGVPYNWWVHAANTDGHSAALDGPDFTCNLPVPRGFHYECLDNNAKVRIGWQTSDGTDPGRYEVRLDAYSPSWNDNCDNDGDVCQTVTEQEAEFEIESGVPYRFWAHSALGDVWSESINPMAFSCGEVPDPTLIPSSTPTVTPSPSPSYTPTPTVTPTPSSTPIPTATYTPSPTLIPNTPTVTETTVTPEPTGADECARRGEGDADCNGSIEKNDFECWKGFYISTVMDTERGCQYTDFDNFGGTNLLDYAIWYISFINET
ncbi:hypothetical protein IPM65_03910 [Candidatus Roizmanbacteria bacterium]|nr:MAG: hypothetical protein IPM65_03910 [Candidatus Roizmanbacteria bacterium]